MQRRECRGLGFYTVPAIIVAAARKHLRKGRYEQRVTIVAT